VQIFLFVLFLVCTPAAFSDEQTKPDFSEAIRLIDTWLEAQRDYDNHLYSPSTYFQYSNLGMTLLGEIVAEVSGMPYQKYIEENILKLSGKKWCLKGIRPEK